jgi:rhodanese-related sulfurtransferase
MTLKVLWRKDDGVVMGAQCIGHAGVDKRIDVLATAIQANMTMRDISEVELCYAPPFGSPKDPVNFAGMVAVNAFDDVMPLKHWDMLEHMNPEEYIVLDVRDDDERSEGHVPGSAHLPVDEIRERIEELEQYRGREILVHCMVGIRSYIAGRILKQNGFNVSNLSGGYKTFCQYHPTTCRKELSRNDELKESFCTTPRG